MSDGLVADAAHIGEASETGVRLDLDRLPVSEPASLWLAGQPSRSEALAALATGGDDYEVVCAVPPERAAAMIAVTESAGLALTDVGEVIPGRGGQAFFDGEPLRLERTGWRHR